MSQAGLDTTDTYLPDFCSGRMALGIVLLSELVAIVLTIARHHYVQNFWVDLAELSMLLLWIGLGCTFVLCYTRPKLAGLSVTLSSVACLLIMLAVTALVSEAVFQLGRYYNARTLGGLVDVFPTQHAGFLLRNLAIALIVGALALRYYYVSHQWRRNTQMEARARIQALQARIRPHFLFNSMNTIAELTRSSPEQAEQAVEDLADLFRASLSDSSQRIDLKAELEMARIYQRIEALRLGDRLRVKWNIEDLPLRAQIPALVLQPLLENAIYHGIENLPEGGTITITGEYDADMLHITIDNPVPKQQNSRRRSGNQIALTNIRERFELAYGGRATVAIEQDEQRHRVRLSFPERMVES